MSQPRPINVKKTVIAVALLAAFFAFTYTRDLKANGFRVLRGQTMGTTYEIKLPDFQGRRSDLHALQERIDTRLVEINRQMSPWVAESETAAFNAYRQVQPFRVSREFADVTRYALQLSRDTDGAFDPTLGPLIDLWGFGPAAPRVAPPSDEEIATARARTGHRRLSVPGAQQIMKRHPEMELNLSAIAKGFAVDDLLNGLVEEGYTNVYVEIGGDVRVAGLNAEGVPWRIGIESPEVARGRTPMRVLHLTNNAVATSGDYRNFFVGPDGNRYSHILDPRTGSPVTNRIASAAVIADTCMEADGIATALLVMPPDEGIAWVNARPSVEALLLLHTDGDNFEPMESEGLAARTTAPRP